MLTLAPEDIPRIPKFAPRPKCEDYAFLRDQGIAHMQRMGHALWTDFNSHDPGITIEEALCYALTDLAYKARTPIEDLLAEPLPEGAEPADTLYTPRRILTCNPVTALDYRMLLIDCPGVENGWLVPVPEPEPVFHVDCEQGILTYEEKFGLLARHRATLSDNDVPDPVIDRLSGLFGQVFLAADALAAALQAILTDAEWDAFGGLLLKLGDRFPTLPPQGVSDVSLELEPDPQLGDLNLARFALDGSSGDTGFDFAVYLGGEWQSWLHETLAETIDPARFFQPVDWDPAARLYRTSMRVPFQDGRAASVSVNAVSTRLRDLFDHDSLTTNVTPDVDATLAGAAPAIFEEFRKRFAQAAKTVDGARDRLHAHRSLCEDYGAIHIAGTDEIGLCAEIEVNEGADIDRVSAEIRHRVQTFLAPRVLFRTLKERLESGLAFDDIFNGPALRHGFLDAGEVESADLRAELHTSDLINIIMDIPEVTAVRDLQISRFHMGETLEAGERWCLILSGERTLRLSKAHSRLIFYKGLIPYQADEEEAETNLRKLQLLDRAKRLEESDYDVPVPTGRARGVRRYHSVQNEFPMTYGIGRIGLSTTSSAQRKAQARQLKAYLLLFDQLLADYLAQLGHLRQLFSLDARMRRTYFGQPLYSLPESYRVTATALQRLEAAGVPAAVRNDLRNLQDEATAAEDVFRVSVEGTIDPAAFDAHADTIVDACRHAAREQPDVPRIVPLVKPFVDAHYGPEMDWDRPATFDVEWEQFRTEAAGTWLDAHTAGDPLREDADTFAERRNRMLDHLMARFAESFTDYAVQVFTLDRRNAPTDLISDKIAFLQDYTQISRDRGKASNYRLAKVWNSDNVSGLERRIARLLGLESFRRRRLAASYLSAFEVFEEPDSDPATFRFRLLDARGDAVLLSAGTFPTSEAAYAGIRAVVEEGIRNENWSVAPDDQGLFRIRLFDRPAGTANAVLLGDRGDQAFPDREDAWRERARSQEAVFRAGRLSEGFHLVEHILLRPRVAPGDTLLAVCTDGDCETCTGFLDPYSFRATVVVPATVGRFLNAEFRRFAEATMREAAPAHIHLKICWVDESDLASFEAAYGRWLAEMSRDIVAPGELSDAQNDLLAVMSALRSVYPQVHLHDCTDDGGGPPAVLDNSILGSREDIEDD
ncbi:MAG: hypothetical protein GY953_01060 [bacterium]|nr:hypothetical protein [bacterium]